MQKGLVDMNDQIIAMPFQPSFEETVATLKIDRELEEEFSDIYAACIAIAQPKAIFCLESVTHGKTSTIIGSEEFSSQIMRINMQSIGRAFPYAVSCGRELYDLAYSESDPLLHWWIDSFAQYAMRAVDKAMTSALVQKYRLGHTARMNPGSLPDFPITCQHSLFHLLGDGPQRIGLELTDSCLMLPYKSVSGIIYETDTDFENCMLCPREHCPTRRSPFQPSMSETIYHIPNID